MNQKSNFYKDIKKLSDRMKQVDKRAIFTAVAVTLIFVAIWLIFGTHLADYSQKYRVAIKDKIIAQTENESESVSSLFSAKAAKVMYLKESISRNGAENVEELPNILYNIMNTGEFINVVFVDTEGYVYFQDGVKASGYDTKSVINRISVDKKYTVIPNMNHFITDDGSFLIATSVVSEDRVFGYIVAIASYDSLVLDSTLRREIEYDEIMLDEKGDIIAVVSSSGDVKVETKTNPFFDYVQKDTLEEDYTAFVEEYKECVMAGTSGIYSIESNGQKIVNIFYPIADSNGWSIMYCINDGEIERLMTKMQINSIGLFVLIVCCMIGASIIIVRYVGREKKRLTDLEFLDGLTGVYNRNAFVSRSEEVLKENKKLPYYMICFDVVNFRIINETYGHERSNVIIKAMADACKDAFGHNEAYGRLTADVFVAVTVDDGEEDERIKYIEEHVAEEARKVYINHPIKIKRGRYEIADTLESLDSMIDKANIARKYVNNNASILSCQYSEKLMDQARKNEEIESRMDAALARGEFKPFLQVKYNMVENKPSGAEALVRWIRDDGSIVPPGDFIPLFEQNGFVEKLDFYMLEQVCKYLRRMIDEGREVFVVSVNQSRYLMNDPNYVNRVKEILLKYKIPVGLIELELTETVFFHEKERMIKMMNDLKAINVKLSIDDFGSGYSSFNILKDVPFDVLKIDREFLSDSVHTEKGKIILERIVDLAHGLGMSVICEGVENEEQIELLVSIGCHYAQGFYYSRPIPLEEFIVKYNHVK